MKPMIFNPLNGRLLHESERKNPADWRPVAGTPTSIADGLVWGFNPWTGSNRSYQDVGADPWGRTLVPPVDDLAAAIERRKSGEPMPPMQDVIIDRRNPKDAAGRAKVPLWLLSPVAKAAWAMAQFVGKVKYGAWNWRGTEVYASVYISAAMRHLDAWLSGEETDPDDGTHHLGNVMACCAILLDAAAAGKLVDDRPPRVTHRSAYKAAEAIVAPTEQRYADRTPPKHWTIADSAAPATLPTNQQGEHHELTSGSLPQPGRAADARPQDRAALGAEGC